MDFRQTILNLIIIMPVFLLSISVHEFSHGYAAYLKGDPTAKNRGRLTLNPVAHLDVMGTLVLVLTQMIGWAKPVPVNPGFFKDPRKDMMFVSVAGPASNLVLAFLLALFRHFLIFTGLLPAWSGIYLTGSGAADVVGMLFFLGIRLNIALAFFNLIPVPPLDGSKILRGLLPPRYDHIINKLEGPQGMILIVILVMFGLHRIVLLPLINFFMGILI